MRLDSERIDVVEGERIRAVGMVGVPVAGLLVAGGLDYLRHSLEDTGFRDVRLFPAPPIDWTRGRDVQKPLSLEWPLWLELTPTRSASFKRELIEEIRILDAWDARVDASSELAPFHPYAVAAHAATRVQFVRTFAVAYPLEVL